MLESKYQAKIIKAIEKKGGHVVNGQFTKKGEADLQCGYPVDGVLRYLAVEVKTEKDYHRVMSGKYKEHELMQKIKIDRVKSLGGLALFAYCIEQVEEYINENM